MRAPFHFALLALSLCVTSAAAVETTATPVPVNYGKPLSKAPILPVSEIISSSEKFEGKTVKMTGVVTQVCQAKGCWFEVAPSDKSRGVRIRSADYTIFVPRDSAGRTAVVEGTFRTTTLSAQEARHLAEDGAKVAGDGKAAQKEFQMAAVAVELH